MSPQDDPGSASVPFALRFLKRLLIGAWACGATYLVLAAVIVSTARLAVDAGLRRGFAGRPPLTDQAISDEVELYLGHLRGGLFRALVLGLCFFLVYRAVCAARAHRRRVTVLSIAACVGAIVTVGWILWPASPPSPPGPPTYKAQSIPPSAARDSLTPGEMSSDANTARSDFSAGRQHQALRAAEAATSSPR